MSYAPRMTRVNAALLAGAVSVLIFAVVIALVDWLVGTGGFSRAVESPLFIIGVIAFNSVAIPLVIWRRRREEREDMDEPLRPLRPSERPIGRRGL